MPRGDLPYNYLGYSDAFGNLANWTNDGFGAANFWNELSNRRWNNASANFTNHISKKFCVAIHIKVSRKRARAESTKLLNQNWASKQTLKVQTQ